MAAPRQYSDAQRAAMFRLFEAGKTPAEIARLCEEGTAGVNPFQIPRRTCHDIVTKMAEEAERKLPTSIVEAESAEAVDRFPVRIARLIDAEIARLTTKQEKGGLNVGDYDKLERAAKLSFELEKRLRRRTTPTRRGGQNARGGTGSSPTLETALERLAREEAEREWGEDQLSSTRACHPAENQGDDQPPSENLVEPADADRPGGSAAITVEHREEAAQKARAALASAA